MLDHVFTDAIGALRDSLEGVLLERQALEERYQVDVLLGDHTWETSYGLPGEQDPPRIRVDITLEWPTWAQSSYRSWYIGEEMAEPPIITVQVSFRLQELSAPPDPAMLLSALPDTGPLLGAEALMRSGPTLETVYGHDLTQPPWFTAVVTFEGLFEFSDATLEDGTNLDGSFKEVGSWVSSTLVKLGDLPVTFRSSPD